MSEFVDAPEYHIVEVVSYYRKLSHFNEDKLNE